MGFLAITSWEMGRPPRHSAGWALARNRPADPGVLDLPYESWQLDLPDGTSLPVWDIRADSPTHEADCPTLVFLHGWAHSRIHSLERLSSILRSGGFTEGAPPFRTILLDLRGHGDADPGRSTLGERDVEDVCTLIERLGEPGVVLIGHSLGGVIAIHAAARTPGLVHGVVALAPYDRLRTPINGTLRARGLPHGVFADVIARIASSSEHRRTDTRDSARQMTQPLHVFAGENDRICPLSIARLIAEAAPQGEFTLLEKLCPREPS